MLIISNFFMAVAIVLDYALNIYMWIVIASAVLSWVNPDPYNPIVRFLRKATEPVFYLIRKHLPVTFGGMDMSPIVVFLVIIFLQNFVVKSLIGLSRSM
nr:YggT family protein [uncultured Desulfobacter sp.]